MIRIVDISKSFEGREVLNGISATFEKGKANLVIGQSGSGKTVLLKSIVGLHKIDGGEIYYDDVCFSALGTQDKRVMMRNGGMLFQGGALLDTLTVAENVRFPLDMFTHQSEKEKDDRVAFCLHRVNLSDAEGLYPSELSGGMIKRAAIARAIVLNPKYLFCDEPNSGLDPKTSMLIDDLIVEITKEFDITTIINTHDMNSVMRIGETIIFLYEGRKWWQGDKDSIIGSDNKELNDFVFASSSAIARAFTMHGKETKGGNAQRGNSAGGEAK